MFLAQKKENLFFVTHLLGLFRGSYISAHASNGYILNKLEKRDKIQGLPSNLSLFRNKFNKVK